MKVKLEAWGLPILSEALEDDKEVEFEGNTVDALIQELLNKYGAPLRGELLDHRGELDIVVFIIINEDKKVPRYQLKTTVLREGDTVTFLIPLAGG